MQPDPSPPPAHGLVRIGARQVDFGTLRVDAAERLSPKAAHVLWLLARNAGRTLEKDWLLDAAWAGQPRVPDVLVQAISEIRRVLGDSGRSGMVLTVPKVGYRLQAEVIWSAEVSASAPAEPAAETITAPAPRGRGVRHWAPALGALLVAAVLLGWWFGPPQTATPEAPPSEPRWALRDWRRLTSEPGADLQPRLAPDGARLAYVRRADSGRYKVHLRALDGSPAQPLALGIDADDVQPAWSPQGDRLAWQRFAGDCQYIVHELATGKERSVGGCFTDLSTPIEWRADGGALLITDRLESKQPVLHLVELDLDSGALRLLDYARANDQADFEPRLAPDGQQLAFRRGGSQSSELWLFDPAAGSTRNLLRLGGGILGYDWLADGSGMLLASREGGRSRLELLTLQGERRVIGEQALRRLHRAGTLWVAQEAQSSGGLWRHVDGQSQPALAEGRGHDQFPALRADGSLLFVSDRSGHDELWLQQGAAAAPRQLSQRRAGALGEALPQADGSVLFSELWQGQWRLRRWRADGSEQAVVDDARYRISQLAEAAGALWAIGTLAERPGSSELLRLDPEGDRFRVVQTAVPAIIVRSDAEGPQVRQYLQRGIVAVDPRTFALGERHGDRHFLDWRALPDGLLYWVASDALRTELRWLGKDGQTAVLLPADAGYEPGGGLLQLPDGSLIYARNEQDAVDIVAFSLVPAEANP